MFRYVIDLKNFLAPRLILPPQVSKLNPAPILQSLFTRMDNDGKMLTLLPIVK